MSTRTDTERLAWLAYRGTAYRFGQLQSDMIMRMNDMEPSEIDDDVVANAFRYAIDAAMDEEEKAGDER